MIKCIPLFIVAVCLLLILIGIALLPTIEVVFTSFPELLWGQLFLASETKSLPPRAYQSTEFVLNQVTLSEIKQAVYIALYDDVLFWDPQYVGFARTELNEDEINTLLKLLTTGNHFQQTPDGNSYECVVQSPMHKPKLETCTDGKQYMDQYLSYQWDAKQERNIGVLQFFLTGGRLAEIRIYPSEQGLAYTPREINGDWWLNGVTDSSPLLKELQSRVSLPPIFVLWSELTASQANRRAARIIGNRYQLALELIRNSSVVYNAFGPILEIRPALGINYYSSWMDSTSLFLTFRITGARGEGAAIIQGYDCFDLHMVSRGFPLDDGSSYVCP